MVDLRKIFAYIEQKLMLRERIILMLKLFRFSLFLSLIAMNFEAEAKINIAIIAPKAEEYAVQGKELISGAKQAVNEINSSGGLLGKKVKLMEIDDQCNNSIAISTAQMITILKENKIDLVIGPYCANSFAEVADIYAKAKIFQIIPTTVNYSQAKIIKKGLVKMLGYTTQQSKAFFDFYNVNFAGKKVALIYNGEQSESQEDADEIISEFSKHGKSLVLKAYDLADKKYTDLAELVIEDGNEIAFISGTERNIRKTVKALKTEKSDFIVFTNKYAAGSKYISYLDNLADGTYFMELQGQTDDPEFTETLVKLRLRGFEIDGLSLYGYAAVNLWKTLVTKAHSFAYDKLSAQINNKSIKTELGYKMFNNGVPKNNEKYAVYRYIDGQYLKQ